MKKPFNINLDMDVKIELDNLAKEQGFSSSWIINNLIVEYISKHKKQKMVKQEIIDNPPPELTKEEEQAFIERMEKKHGVFDTNA